MPSTTPTLYFPGSKKLVMVLDHRHRFLISNDHPWKADIAHMVFMSENAHQMETLAVNGHRCRLEELVQRIHAHVMASTDLGKGGPSAYKDNASTPRDVEEKCIGGKVYHYIPRHQVDALTQEVLSDIQKNHRAGNLRKMERQVKIDAIEMASTDLEKGCLPAYNDKATTPPPYSDEEKRVGVKQHIYLPRHEADALMLTQDVLFGIQNCQRATTLKKMERQLRMNAFVLLILKIIMVLLILKIIMVLAVLAMLMLDWSVTFRVRGR